MALLPLNEKHSQNFDFVKRDKFFVLLNFSGCSLKKITKQIRNIRPHIHFLIKK